MVAGWLFALLALAGLGLGIFVPANNAVIMRSAHAGSASVVIALAIRPLPGQGGGPAGTEPGHAFG